VDTNEPSDPAARFRWGKVLPQFLHAFATAAPFRARTIVKALEGADLDELHRHFFAPENWPRISGCSRAILDGNEKTLDRGALLGEKLSARWIRHPDPSGEVIFERIERSAPSAPSSSITQNYVRIVEPVRFHLSPDI
jgi:hypothetical protein